jgi:hypothetical protein
MQLRELWRASEPLFDRRSAEQHDDSRRDEIDLPLEPVLPAYRQFIVTRRPILRWPVFSRCWSRRTRARVNPIRLIEELAGSANEWTTFGVFCSAGASPTNITRADSSPSPGTARVRLSQSRHFLHRRIR